MKEILNLKKYIRNIPDFPQKGIVFRDITPLLKNQKVFRYVINKLTKYFLKYRPQKILAVEARGFILGGCLAYKLKCGFVPVRKKGKLPSKTISINYGLEYGESILEIHQDAIKKGDRVVIVDDVLATGGTAKAAIELVEKCGGKVLALGFLVELAYLNPRQKLEGYNIFSLVKY